MNYVFGPVPSRRLGLSLGISPIPAKTCNYSCTYCQLGRTDHLTNQRQLFFPLAHIITELETVLAANPTFDVATIVGEGEPTLYLALGSLIDAVKSRVDKPVAVITNGALVGDPQVREELAYADIVLISMDAYDETSFRKINRPHGRLNFEEVFQGLKDFSYQYNGQLWLEIMLIDDNVHTDALKFFASMLQSIEYQRLFLNTPVRPPAEPNIRPLPPAKMQEAVSVLGGTAIDLLTSQGFQSQIADHYDAILSIIQRHPMNQHEIESFLTSRDSDDTQQILERLKKDESVSVIDYMGFTTYRRKQL